MLNREAILKAEDFETREVDVPEWGGSVTLRGLSARDRDAFETACGADEVENLRAQLLVKSLVDENGERIFQDDEIGLLGGKSAEVVSRLFDVVRELCGMTDEALGIAEGN